MPSACAMLTYFGLLVVDSPPKTLQFEIHSWRNTSWGFHAIDRSRLRCTVAIAVDGSRSNQCQQEEFRHFFIPDGTLNMKTLSLRPANRVYVIDDNDRTAKGRDCGYIRQMSALKQSHDRCLTVANGRLSRHKQVGTGQIAGQRVYRYRGIDDEGTVMDLAVAPEAGCEIMEEITTYSGTLGIPGARFGYRVTSYDPTPPDAKLFEVPAGYTILNSKY